MVHALSGQTVLFLYPQNNLRVSLFIKNVCSLPLTPGVVHAVCVLIGNAAYREIMSETGTSLV